MIPPFGLLRRYASRNDVFLLVCSAFCTQHFSVFLTMPVFVSELQQGFAVGVGGVDVVAGFVKEGQKCVEVFSLHAAVGFFEQVKIPVYAFGCLKVEEGLMRSSSNTSPSTFCLSFFSDMVVCYLFFGLLHQRCWFAMTFSLDCSSLRFSQ